MAVTNPAATAQSAFTVTQGTAGELARTPGVRLAHGDYVATVQVRLDAPATGAVAVAVPACGP